MVEAVNPKHEATTKSDEEALVSQQCNESTSLCSRKLYSLVGEEPVSRVLRNGSKHPIQSQAICRYAFQAHTNLDRTTNQNTEF